MHSSRMRTGRTLTVFRYLAPGGVSPKKAEIKKKIPPLTPSPPRKIGDTPHRDQTPPPGTRHHHPPPPVNRITHACENITLAKTSFRPVTRLVTEPGFPNGALHYKECCQTIFFNFFLKNCMEMTKKWLKNEAALPSQTKSRQRNWSFILQRSRRFVLMKFEFHHS